MTYNKKSLLALMANCMLLLTSFQEANAGDEHRSFRHEVGKNRKSDHHAKYKHRIHKLLQGVQVTWNGNGWVPEIFVRLSQIDLAEGEYIGQQLVWLNQDWVLTNDEGGNNSNTKVKSVTAGLGLKANGVLGGTITSTGILDIDVGTNALQIPFINENNTLIIDGLIHSRLSGFMFPDGTIQTTASQGIAGPQGERGYMGPQGPQGLMGERGADGAPGVQGPQGLPGFQGVKGDRGDAGPMGPQGLQGERGLTGLPGLQGPTGLPGLQGLPGSDATVNLVPGVGIVNNGPIGSTGTISVDVGNSAGKIPQLDDDGKLNSSVIPSGSKGNIIKVAFVKDIKPNGVHGGTCVTGFWNIRDLNTLQGNTSFISLSGNRFTLQPGNYIIEGNAPAFVTSQHKVKIRDVTNNQDLIIGSSGFSHNSFPSLTYSNFMGQVNITATTSFEVQHVCSNATNGVSLGVAGNFGASEVYTQVKITKIE